MTDVKALIRDARLPEEEVPLCLRVDLVKKYEQAEAELTKLRKGADSLAGPGERAAELEATLADLREQMTGSTLTVTLRALPSPRYQAVKDEHPPRTTDDGIDMRDVRAGFNIDTFFVALARACVIAPALDDEDWEALVGDDGKLTDAQVGKLCDTAWTLNRKDVDLPF